MHAIKLTISGLIWVIVCLAIGMAVVRGAPGASGVIWRFLLIMLGLVVAQWIWFIVVPRQSLRLAGGNPDRQRRLLRLVINTPFPSGPKVFARFLLAASDQVGKALRAGRAAVSGDPRGN